MIPQIFTRLNFHDNWTFLIDCNPKNNLGTTMEERLKNKFPIYNCMFRGYRS